MQYGRCWIRACSLLSNARLPAWALLIRIILLTPLAACAVHTPYPFGIKGNPHVIIAVTSTTASADVSSLSDIRSVSKSDIKNNEQTQIRETLEKVRMNVDACMRNRLSQREGVRMEQGAHSMDEDKMELSWAKERGADLVLAVDVSGYGHVKRKWILLMAGTGLIETVAQGVAAAGVTGNPAVGAGVAAEEIAQESLWLGGVWLWNKYLAPVTLEGRMWRVRDGKLIWHDVQFTDSSNLFGLLFGKKQPKKEKALAMSLKKAEDDLFSDLVRYIDRQILHPGKGRV